MTFLAGLFLGAPFGALIMALVIAAGRSDEPEFGYPDLNREPRDLA